MYIQKIKITNFKSIYEPLEINFNEVTGLWKISGSVGSGKTTIGEAIIFGLFGSVGGKNNSDLISWGEKHGLVETWCTSKGRSIYIKREMNSYGQSPIYVEIDGEELIFTNKRDAQQQLEKEYFDTSKVALELLCIISFNNFKSLATLNTSDAKKFLDQVLGFYTLTQYADKCKELKYNNLKYVNGIQTEIGKLESQIFKLKEISNVEKIDGEIEEVKNNIKSLKNEIESINHTYKQNLDEALKEKSKLEKERAGVETLGKNKAKEIKFIENGVCPTCGAPIDQSQLDIKKQEKDALGKQYKMLSDKILEVIKVMKELSDDYESTLKPFKDQLQETQTLLIKLQEQEKRLSINIGEIDNLNARIQEKNITLNEHMSEDAEWEMLFNLLSVTVRSKILQSFIPSLNKNILKYTQILHIPYLIQFDPTFKCNVQICGMNQDIALSSLSTGQLKTVDMVIILGVLGTIIGTQHCNIIFLDELFSNLDAGLRNDMCTVLRNFIAPDETIFIISHTELDNSYFDGDIHMKLELKNQYEKHSKATINYLKHE